MTDFELFRPLTSRDMDEMLDRDTTGPECIVRAAVKSGGIAFSLPQPARHHNVMHTLLAMAGDQFGPDQFHDQGFITSRGRYVGREEGKRIAIAAGQLLDPDDAASRGASLYSEDVW